MDYFFANGNEQRGPYSLEQLAALGLRPDTLVWRDGLSQWQRADSFPELVALIPIATPAAPMLRAPATSIPTPATLGYSGIAASARTDGFAIASLVLGIVSFPVLCLYGLGLITAILAIVFGFVARSRIKSGMTSGDGIARAGLILGVIGVLMPVALLIVVVVIAIVAHA